MIPDNKIYAGDIPEGETELTTAANKTLTVVKKWVCVVWESSRTLKILYSKVRYIAAWKTWSVSHFCLYNVGIARLSLHCILLPAAAQPHVFHPFESVRVPRRCSNPPLHMKPTLRVYPANIDTSFPLLFFSCSQGWQGGHQVWRRQM